MPSTGTSPMAKAGEEAVRQPGHVDNDANRVSSSGKEGVQQQKLASIREMFSLATPREMAVFHASHAGAFICGIGQPLLCIFFGSLLGELTDDSSPDEIMDKISEVAANMALVGVVCAFASWIRSSGFRWFSQEMVFKYRFLYLQSVLHQDVAWFDTRELASLPSQMAVDAEKIIESFNDNLGTSLMAVWGCLGGCVFAYVFGWQLALVMSCTIPFHAAGVLYMAKATESVQGEAQSWYAKASVVVEECLYAFRTVVSFGGEKRELATFEHAVEQARKAGVTNGFKIGLSIGYANMFMYLGYALSYYIGSVFIDAGVESWYTGDVYDNSSILATFACNFIGGFFLGNIPSGVLSFTKGRAAMARFLDVYHSRSVIERRLEDERVLCPPIETMEIREVHFSYPTRPEVPVLRGLSLEIGKGQKVAVVGESGSGKSTVMALLERFYDPVSGMVLVNGQDIKTIAVKSLRRSIGYVGQEPVLFTTSVKENILQGAPQMGNTQAELDQVIIEAELGFVMDMPQGLNTYVGSGGSQFSGGQKQRIAIARALIKKTSVLFFDEATSALDNKSEKMIQRTIMRISEKAPGNLSMVSIAHRLSTIRNSDVIYVMSRGEVVEIGTHTELVQKRGTYYALASTQQVAEEEETVRIGASQQGENEAMDSAIVPVDVDDKKLDQQGSPQPPISIDAAEAERKKKLAKEYKVPLLRMMSYCRPEWFWLLPALGGSLAEGLAMPVSGVAIIRGASSLANPDMEEMRSDTEFYAIFLVGVALTQFLCGILSKGCIAIVGEAMTKRLRVELLCHYFRQEVGFHDDPKHTPAQLGQALEIWAHRIAILVKAWAGQFQAICAVIAGLVIAFWHSWEVSLGVLAALPIMVGTNAIAMVILFGGSKARAEGLLRAQQLVSDAVQNPRVCHACANEDELVNLFKSFISSANISMKVIVLNGLVVGICGGMMFWVLAGGYYFCGYLMSEGVRSNTEVTIAFMSIFYGAFSAGLASTSIGDIKSAKVAAHDLFETLDRKSKIDSWEPTGEIPEFSNPMDAGRISFEAVKFKYPFRPDVQVLKGITLEVQQGQSAGLVGPSGSGKSTVMALIQRFYDPDEGVVWIGAEKKALANIDIRWWRTQLGFVGQEPILFNTTVRANIAYGVSDESTISDEWFEECARRSNLAFLDNEPRRFDTEVGPRGSRLSGGQKQRVAICRALVRNPPVLLFDEATSALDTQSEQIVQSALEVAREGRTSFSIAHRLSTVAGCQIIIVVSAGIVVEQGCHDELLAAGGVYSKLVEAASQINS